jgi:hypothetical protein
MKGVVVSEGDSYEEVLINIKSAIQCELFSHGEGGARHGCLAARAGYLPRHLVFGRQRKYQ